MGVIWLGVGFIVTASLVFAAVSVSSLTLWAFPIVVSIWIAFLWAFIGQGIARFSTPPHRPRRVIGLVVGCSLVAIVALAMSILIGLLIIGPRGADL